MKKAFFIYALLTMLISSKMIAQPAGTVIAYAGTREAVARLEASGWLLCDGALYDRTNARYKNLFDAIGTTWGGDGGNMFSVPDLRGQFLRGVSDGSGNDPDANSRANSRPDLHSPGNGGNAVGSKQNDEFKSHNHTWSTGRGWASGGNQIYARNDAGYDVVLPTSSAGGNETRPKNAYVYYIIKL